MAVGLVLTKAQAALILGQDGGIAGGAKKAGMMTYVGWGVIRVGFGGRRLGSSGCRGSGGRGSLRRAEHRLRARGTRAGQRGGVVDTLVGLVATGTSATSGHDVVATEFALATWFTGLELAIATVRGIQPWRVRVSGELLW